MADGGDTKSIGPRSLRSPLCAYQSANFRFDGISLSGSRGIVAEVFVTSQSSASLQRMMSSRRWYWLS